MRIAFRPHHFLCALCFKGKGYSAAFVDNFQGIMDVLRAPGGDETNIDVVGHTDSICTPCPHRLEKLCATQEQITVLDDAHANVLGLVPGETLTWGQAKSRIAEKMSLEKFHGACKTCEWKELGICEGVLTEFLQPVLSA